MASCNTLTAWKRQSTYYGQAATAQPIIGVVCCSVGFRVTMSALPSPAPTVVQHWRGASSFGSEKSQRDQNKTRMHNCNANRNTVCPIPVNAPKAGAANCCDPPRYAFTTRQTRLSFKVPRQNRKFGLFSIPAVNGTNKIVRVSSYGQQPFISTISNSEFNQEQ